MDEARRQGVFPDFLETVAGVNGKVHRVLGAQKAGLAQGVYFRKLSPYQCGGDA
jgi:hypothetical protein